MCIPRSQPSCLIFTIPPMAAALGAQTGDLCHLDLTASCFVRAAHSKSLHFAYFSGKHETGCVTLFEWRLFEMLCSIFRSMR